MSCTRRSLCGDQATVPKEEASLQQSSSSKLPDYGHLFCELQQKIELTTAAATENSIPGQSAFSSEGTGSKSATIYVWLHTHLADVQCSYLRLFPYL